MIPIPRRVRLVRGEGRGVSTQYEGGRVRTKRKGRPGPRLNSMPPLSDRRTRSESPSVPGGTAQLACSGPERRAGAIAVTLLLLDLEGTRRVHLVRGEGRDLSG